MPAVSTDRRQPEQERQAKASYVQVMIDPNLVSVYSHSLCVSRWTSEFGYSPNDGEFSIGQRKLSLIVGDAEVSIIDRATQEQVFSVERSPLQFDRSFELS